MKLNRQRLAVLIALPVALAAGGCAVNSIAPAVTPAMATPGVSTATLNTGRTIFANRCSACHALDPVGSHSVTEWARIVDDMAGRAKLTSSDRTSLLAYVKAAHAVAAVQ